MSDSSIQAAPSLAPPEPRQESSHKQIYSFDSGLPVFSLDWSQRRDKPFRLAFTSFIEKVTNKITVVQLDETEGKLKQVTAVDHDFPPTKVMWLPSADTDKPDLFASTGDVLRIWEMKDGTAVNKCQLSSQTYGSEFHAPLTSFDWNWTDPNIIGTASVDTTCTIWDIRNERATAQLIAHDKEVFDIAFTQGTFVFTTVGADGSVRLFDLRNLEHSTIIYESPKYSPLLRVKWSHADSNLLATLIMDSQSVIILDIRQPSLPLVTLKRHEKSALAVEWSPTSAQYLATGSEDKQAYIWNLQPALVPSTADSKQQQKYKLERRDRQREITEPLLAYGAGHPINGISWSVLQPSWLALSMESSVRILKI